MSNMTLAKAQRELEDAQVESEEMEEDGDLEDRLQASIRLAKAEQRVKDLSR